VIDTHAHLDACEEAPETLIERAHSVGVDRIIAVGSGIESCRAALEIAGQHEGVFAALGVHPHQAGNAEAGRLHELRELIAHERVVAVGETGLDYYRDYAPRDRQRALFAAELEMATESGKPVVVHSRAANQHTADALAGFAGTVILHCFSSPPLLDVALERGYYVSFAGNVTYPKAYDLRACARGVPADRILVETDTPYLAPQPKRGKPNEPANVAHTLAALAEARGEDVQELEARIDANASAAFSLGE
jgi:TatD DNase family protein